MSENKEKEPPLLLKKWQLRLILDKDKSLSKGDGAVFAQILEHYNPKVGYSYPSFNRLANVTGFSKANTQNSVKRLIDARYIEIIQHGNRHNMANRYQPNFNLLDGGVCKPACIGGVCKPDCTGVCKPACQAMQAGFTSYASPLVSNPSTNPSINEGEVDEENATLANPLRGSPLASKSKAKPEREYAEFWDVYIKRENVTDANKAIKEALENGDNYGEIVEGAKSYMAWIEHEGKEYRYIKQPFNFITKENWREDHKITPAKPPKTREKKKADNLSMVDKENNMSKEEMKKLAIKHEIELENHAENCTSCNGFFTEYESENDAPFQFDFCEIGKPLFYEMYRLRAMMENIEPDYSITKTELIEHRHDTQLSYLRLQNSHNDDLDYRQSIIDDNEETYYQMLSESYHLFKSNEA
jgi:hypothetical protein